MTGNALVLGGGGALGIAWEIGLLGGLIEEGIDTTGADLIVGTSAGSVVGTQIALGESLEELLAEQVAPDDGALGRLIQIDLQGTQQIFMRWAGDQRSDAGGAQGNRRDGRRSQDRKRRELGRVFRRAYRRKALARS